MPYRIYGIIKNTQQKNQHLTHLLSLIIKCRLKWEDGIRGI